MYTCLERQAEPSLCTGKHSNKALPIAHIYTDGPPHRWMYLRCRTYMRWICLSLIKLSLVGTMYRVSAWLVLMCKSWFCMYVCMRVCVCACVYFRARHSRWHRKGSSAERVWRWSTAVSAAWSFGQDSALQTTTRGGQLLNNCIQLKV